MSKQKIVYLVLLLLIVVFAFLAWQSFERLVWNGADSLLVSWLLPIINFFVSGIIFGLLVLLFDFLGFTALAWLAFSLIFVLIFGAEPAYLVGIAVGLGLITLAAWRAKQEKKDRLKIFPNQILPKSLNLIFTVLAMAIALVLYFSPPAQSLGMEIKIPRPLFDLAINSISGIFSGQPQGQSQPGGSFLNIPGLPTINFNELNKAIGGDKLSLDGTLNKEAKDKIYGLFNQQLNFFLKPYKRFLPYGFAIAVFFALKAVSFIFVWLAIGVIEIIFSLMKLLKIVTIKTETAEKETIEI